MEPSANLSHDIARYEILPLGKSEAEAAELPEPVHLTVTCSPKHGPDHSIQFAARLRDIGHTVTVHIAARMVRDAEHVDELLTQMADAGIDDLFLIGGDADPPLGAYRSAVELLPVIAEHPRRPGTIGVGGYPEGHPLIDDATLDEALLVKSAHADYMTTQLCFDAGTLRAWVGRQRERGITLPVLIGMPGQVSAAKLLEMSARIGVGPSMAFVKKQRGLRSLLGLFRRSAPDRLYDALAPELGAELEITGFHYFTFNQLITTYEWHTEKRSRASGRRPVTEPVARGYRHPQESET